MSLVDVLVLKIVRRSFLGLGVLALVGCTTPSFESEDSLILKERNGRFSVQTQAPHEPVQAVQGSFVWRRLTSGWQLDLNSPLGATLARLTVMPAGAILEQPDAPIRRAASGSELLVGVLGASVPLDVLEDWIDGRVLDDSKVTQIKRDTQGRIRSFVQSGWQVTFDRYGPGGPALVSAQGNERGQRVTLRLVAEQPTLK